MEEEEEERLISALLLSSPEMKEGSPKKWSFQAGETWHAGGGRPP